MHYYRHHIGDFLKDTSNLSNEQLAVYMKLLWRYYADENPLENDCEMLAFAVRSDEKTVRLLLKHFFVLTDDGWRQTRCDKEIAEYHSKSEKASGSAKARWSRANDMRTHSERNANASKTDANQEPITNNQEPVNTKPRERGPDFVLPDWIDRDHWDAWHSTPKRKKATPQQKQLAIKKLQAWRDQGLDYAGALENAATGGYQGLFLPNQTRANSNLNKQEALEARNKAVADQWLREQGAIV
jgi:uncharacterized protein YdaU (DUF1376 family)